MQKRLLFKIDYVCKIPWGGGGAGSFLAGSLIRCKGQYKTPLRWRNKNSLLDLVFEKICTKISNMLNFLPIVFVLLNFFFVWVWRRNCSLWMRFPFLHCSIIFNKLKEASKRQKQKIFKINDKLFLTLWKQDSRYFLLNAYLVLDLVLLLSS